MALSQPRPIFGIHSLTAYDRSTGIPFGAELRVLASSNLSSSQELIDLQGGSSYDNWATERGIRTTELSVTFREYSDWLYQLLLGKAPTIVGAETAGNVGTITDLKGTSVVSTSGLASVSALVGSETNLKFGTYVVEAASPTTVNIYSYSDLDFSQGTDTLFVDDTMKINASPLTITAASDTNVTDYGFKLTGAAGPIAMTTGDTAIFHVRSINEGSSEVVIGSRTEVFCNFGLYMTGQRQGDGRMVAINAFNVTGGGLPHNFTEKSFSEAEVTFKLSYDAAHDGLFSVKHLKAASSCS